jgi:predicted O-methyltransferase YrrM
MENKLYEAIEKASGGITFEGAAKQAPEGLMLEFGVHKGHTITQIAKALPDRKIYGFDGFQGLPESWNGLSEGHFACDIPTNLPDNVKLVVGWFDDTLPKFIEEHKEPVAFIHIDCDLYSSTKTVFDVLKDRIQNGTIICFDEIVNYGDNKWRDHEYKAFKEFLVETKYEWKCISKYGTHQAAFKIIM